MRPSFSLAVSLLLVPSALFCQTVTGPAITFNTTLGPINVTLLPASAPLNVANFLTYVNSGAYNGSFIHRSVPGFVFQGGGYQWVNNTVVTIPASPPVQNEYSVPNTRGTLAMALLSGQPDSATDEWFFNEVDNSGTLDSPSNGPFTVIGQVADPASLAIMDQISAVQVYNNVFPPPFDALPLLNYTGGDVATQNLVFVNSIIQTPEPLTCTLQNPAGGITVDSLAVSPVTLSILANGPNCTWTASASDPWFTVSPTSGSGPASVTVTVQPNTTGADRSGSIQIAGQSVSVTQRSTAQEFNDVVPSDYYFDAVNQFQAKNITAGCGFGNYCPSSGVTRDQMAIFIVRTVFGSDNFTYSASPYFGDVPSTYFAFPWIQKLYELGITAGCNSSPLIYCPSAPVTRDQLAIYLIRARYGATAAFTWNTTPYFADVPANYYAFEWIQRLYQDDITAGCSSSPLNYCPANPVIRGDMAIFLLRGGFNQLLPPSLPVVASISPATLTHGTTGTFTVVGINTLFQQGLTQLSFPVSSGVTVNSITVTSAATMQVSLTAELSAPLQPVSIYAQTEPQEAVLPNGLVIQ